ncbi:hypothetical protein JIQ42_02108 [Leishmania sp. Namibia]|uniref:hypothetical protein n=1 Tax=Leishmania sp. Namibia TaxID=2802991 RepID=UPI001B5AEDDB|nr:hypothetical protein JIQ42_02108 [Leishmania sp. Namibia]
MGRRRQVQPVEKDAKKRRQSESGRRSSISAHDTCRIKSKGISSQAPSDAAGHCLSRKGSLGAQGGDAPQEHRSNQLGRNQSKRGDSFCRPPQQLSGGGTVLHNACNAVPLLTHQQHQPQQLQQRYSSEAQQQQQRHRQGMGIPFSAYPMGPSNGQASGSDGDPRYQHRKGSIPPSEPSGSPSLGRHNSQVLVAAGGAAQRPQQPYPPPWCQPRQQYPPYLLHEEFDRSRNWATQDAQGQPCAPYGGGLESVPPPQLSPFCHLPQLPYVMTPQGPMAPPPLYLFTKQAFPLIPGVAPPQQRCGPPENRGGAAAPQRLTTKGNALTTLSQALCEQQHATPDQPPVSSPQPTRARNSSMLAVNGTATSMDPTAAPPAAANTEATAVGGTQLPRTQSILKHTSSFKMGQSRQQADALVTNPALPLPHTTSILNRVSSFKKAGKTTSRGDQAREQEAAVQQRLHAREQERMRLQQEMRARVAADQAAREQRLRELQQRRSSRSFAEQTPTNMAPRLLVKSPKLNDLSGSSTSERGPGSASTAASPSQLPTVLLSPSSRPAAVVAVSSEAPPMHPLPIPVATSHSLAGSHASEENHGMEAPQDDRSSPVPDMSDLSALLEHVESDNAISTDGMASAATATDSDPARGAAAPTAADALTRVVGATQQLWHRCPSLVLYEIPLRCTKTVNKNGEEQIDDSKFPVRLFGRTLRVTDATKQTTTEYHLDELVTHRRGSISVDSKVLQKVVEVLLAGYSASVLSLDSQGLSKSISSFDSAAWLAKQRLLMNVLSAVEKIQSAYSKQVGSIEYFEAAFSFTLVKKVSSKQAAEWNITSLATAQRTYEVVDLLPPEPTTVPLKMDSCVLYGHRIAGVEYRTLRNEAAFMAALTSAQGNANIVLGRLADAVAADPDNQAALNEQASVFQVVTCALRHRKAGSVSLQEQMAEPAEAVYQREAESDAISSDDEDDTEAPTTFRSHNKASDHSDIIMNCLTCIGAQQNHDLWIAAVERNQSMIPTVLFDTAFGGPAYTVVLASVDPTKAESAMALGTQFAMAIKLHRRPLNGSARRLIQVSKYVMADMRKRLSDASCSSDAQQRSFESSISKHGALLDSLGKVLEAMETRRFSLSGSA